MKGLFQLLMPKSKNTWLEELVSKKVIETFNTIDQAFYRIAGDFTFCIPQKAAKDIAKAYDPSFEKGGILLTSIKRLKGKIVLTLEKVDFIQNIAPEPSISYEFDPFVFKQHVHNAFANNRLPIIFHTHPMKSKNIIEEIRMYHSQMETSPPDRCASLFSHEFSLGQLRLPEALIIYDNNLSKGLFIGLYGGLVAPLKFKNEKLFAIFGFCLKQVYEFFGRISTIGEGITKVGGSLLALEVARSHPKEIKQFIKEAHELLSPIAYANVERPRYFGITKGEELIIYVPKPNESYLLEEEMMARMAARGRYKEVN